MQRVVNFTREGRRDERDETIRLGLYHLIFNFSNLIDPGKLWSP